jgi:hypothetical protein
VNPLLVGAGVAALLAGPSLYSLVRSGGLDSTTALGRGLLVAAVCAAGCAFVMNLVKGYEDDWKVKDQEEARKAADDAEAQRIADAISQSVGPNSQNNQGGSPPRPGS